MTGKGGKGTLDLFVKTWPIARFFDWHGLHTFLENRLTRMIMR